MVCLVGLVDFGLFITVWVEPLPWYYSTGLGRYSNLDVVLLEYCYDIAIVSSGIEHWIHPFSALEEYLSTTYLCVVGWPSRFTILLCATPS